MTISTTKATNHEDTKPQSNLRVFVSWWLMMCALCALSGCQTRSTNDAGGIVVVNAPSAGQVRRVLVREGVQVGKDEPLIEIAVREEGQPTPRVQTEDPQTRAARSVTAAQTEIEAARAEVVRTEVEVQRLTPLVSAGQATQGELDGARALYDRAQQRLRQAQDAATGAQSGLTAARQQALNAPAQTMATPTERIVAARATNAGTVSVISARVGDQVTVGQPLATLRTSAP